MTCPSASVYILASQQMQFCDGHQSTDKHKFLQTSRIRHVYPADFFPEIGWLQSGCDQPPANRSLNDRGNWSPRLLRENGGGCSLTGTSLQQADLSQEKRNIEKKEIETHQVHFCATGYANVSENLRRGPAWQHECGFEHQACGKPASHEV